MDDGMAISFAFIFFMCSSPKICDMPQCGSHILDIYNHLMWDVHYACTIDDDNTPHQVVTTYDYDQRRQNWPSCVLDQNEDVICWNSSLNGCKYKL